MSPTRRQFLAGLLVASGLMFVRPLLPTRLGWDHPDSNPIEDIRRAMRIVEEKGYVDGLNWQESGYMDDRNWQ